MQIQAYNARQEIVWDETELDEIAQQFEQGAPALNQEIERADEALRISRIGGTP